MEILSGDLGPWLAVRAWYPETAAVHSVPVAIHHALIAAAWEARDLSLELQLQQHRRYDIGRQAAAPAQSVNIARVVSQVMQQRVRFFRRLA